MDPAQDDDPLALWGKALKEYQEICKTDYNDQPQDLTKMDKNAVIEKSINIVSVVANFVASAPSPVSIFLAKIITLNLTPSKVSSQAQTVVSALKYLLASGQWYRRNFTAKKVLAKVKDVNWNLERISGYVKAHERGTTIDEALGGLITRTMAAYLQLCTVRIKVIQDSKTRSGILKNVVKTVIRSDGGIAACVEEIKQMTDRELNLNVAALRITGIYASETKRREETLMKLRDILKVDRNQEHWTQRQQHLVEKHIPVMGDWLSTESLLFASWANASQKPNHPVLRITRECGFGKTHLCSHTITLLQKKYPSKKDHTLHGQVTISWFYFERSGKRQAPKAKNNQRGSQGSRSRVTSAQERQSSLRDALVALIWQISNNDTAFQKFVLGEFEKQPQGFHTAEQLWNGIFMNFCAQAKRSSQKSKKIFFLIIDGNSHWTKNGNNAIKEIVKGAGTVNEDPRARIQIRILFSTDAEEHGTQPPPTTPTATPYEPAWHLPQRPGRQHTSTPGCLSCRCHPLQTEDHGDIDTYSNQRIMPLDPAKNDGHKGNVQGNRAPDGEKQSHDDPNTGPTVEKSLDLRDVPAITLPSDARRFDVDVFIDHHLQIPDRHWNADTEGHRAIWSIKRRMASMFCSDKCWSYQEILGLLQEVKHISDKSSGLREFERMLRGDEVESNVGAAIVQHELQRLDKELSDDEKVVFNDMLSFFVCWHHWPSRAQLKAFLSFRDTENRKAQMGAELQEKYSKLFSIQSDDTIQAVYLCNFFDGEEVREWHAEHEHTSP